MRTIVSRKSRAGVRMVVVPSVEIIIQMAWGGPGLTSTNHLSYAFDILSGYEIQVSNGETERCQGSYFALLRVFRSLDKGSAERLTEPFSMHRGRRLWALASKR